MVIRKIYILSIILLHSFFLIGQNQFGLGLYSTHTGRSINLTYNLQLVRHNFIIGSKYHINRTPVDNQNHVFYKRFKATNIREHIGLIFDYYFLLGNINHKWKPLVFYNFQYLEAPVERFGFTSRLIPGGGSRGFIKVENISLPIKAFEQYIGLGFQYAVSEKIFLIEKIGLGINFFKDLDPNFFNLKTSAWEASVLLGAAISYQI